MGEHAEGAAAAGFLCRSLGRIVACLDGLDAAEQRWRPPAAGTNSLLAIAAHALANAEENVLGLLGVLPAGVASVQRPSVILRRGTTKHPGAWGGDARILRRLRMTSHAERALTRREVDVRLSPGETRRNVTPHQGQAELTRDLVRARREA